MLKKRKVTKIETYIMAHGFVLDHKTYYGKHSEKTKSYVYIKGNMFIELNRTREYVEHIGLLNVNCPRLSYMELRCIKHDFGHLETFVETMIKELNGEEEPKRLYVEETMEEVESMTAMTPEQLDEYCYELEQKEK